MPFTWKHKAWISLSGKITIYTGVGHLVPIEAAEPFNREVMEFVNLRSTRANIAFSGPAPVPPGNMTTRHAVVHRTVGGLRQKRETRRAAFSVSWVDSPSRR